jgi:hypothetical protein
MFLEVQVGGKDAMKENILIGLFPAFPPKGVSTLSW